MIPRYDAYRFVSRRPRFIHVEERETEAEIDRSFAAHAASQEVNAEKLKVSINTIRDHVRLVYDKLHVHSKSEAVSKALRGGII